MFSWQLTTPCLVERRRWRGGGIAMSKPVVFVGSSSEQLPLVTHLIRALKDKTVPRPWNRSFEPGETTLEALMASANEADFAIFVFGPDDWTESRSAKRASPRDNVVFEAGLFGGMLGWRRSMIVHADGVKLPSDLLGLTLIRYDAKEDPKDQAIVVAAEVEGVIEKRGWGGSESLARQMRGHWWQFTLSEAFKVERSALALVEVHRAHQNLTLEGQAWTAEGKPISQFRSRAASVNEESRTLFYWWEGEWPGDADVPQFFGKGEIQLKEPNVATGYFTIRSDDDRDPRERKSVVYVRATPQDVEAVKGGDASKRRKALGQQLKKRADMLFRRATDRSATGKSAADSRHLAGRQKPVRRR